MRDKQNRALENLRERIETSEQVVEEDRKALLSFSDRLFLMRSLERCVSIRNEISGSIETPRC